MQALLRAHDDVADRNYGDETEEDSQLFSPPPPLSMFSNMPDQVRLVGIRREKNAPLVSHKLTVLTGVEGNTIDFISPWGMKYCPTWSQGQYIRPKGANIIIVARKHSQPFICFMKKTPNQISRKDNYHKNPLWFRLIFTVSLYKNLFETCKVLCFQDQMTHIPL